MCRTETLTVTADSISPTVFTWDFGADATPQTATGRVVSGIRFANVDANIIYLSVTNQEGCIGTDSFQINTLDCVGPGGIGGIGARSSGGVNIINWSAISVLNGSYFDIERSIDNSEFEVIESLDCIATGAWYEYTYEDKFAPSGKVSYRITHRSPMADAGPSESVEVTVEQVELFSRVYPNPVGNQLTVEVAAADLGDIDFQVINSFGAIMLQGTLQAGRHNVDVQHLPTGTYHLRSIAPNGAVEVRTIVKN